MNNEITALLNTNNVVRPILAFAQKEVYDCDIDGVATQLWEITEPQILFVDQTTTPFIPGEASYLQAFGDYYGTDPLGIVVKMASDTTFQWSLDGGATFTSAYAIVDTPVQLVAGVSIRFKTTEFHKSGQSWNFCVLKRAFYDSEVFQRWSITQYDNSVFFTNPENIIKWINGKTINNFAWATKAALSGRHLCLFMEHLFVSDPNDYTGYFQNCVRWSDLRNFAEFESNLFTTNADRYDFPSPMNSIEQVEGITGLAQLGQFLMVYNGHCIWKLTYIGGKFIMQKEPVSDRIGCAFHYGVVSTVQLHVFPGQDSFYLIDDQLVPKRIGDRIWRAFQADISKDIAHRQKLWGYVDQDRREVWWVYCSNTSTGNFDRKVGYNYVSDTWQFADADEHSFLHSNIRSGGTVIGDLTTENIGDIEIPISLIGSPNLITEVRFYGQSDRKVSVEVTNPEAEIDQSQSEPFLETGDIIYDPTRQAQVDGMYIHADYDESSCDGIELQFSYRDNLGEAVTWHTAPVLWNKDKRNSRFSWPRMISGRVFRFRFTFKKKVVESVPVLAVRMAKFYFWNEIVKGLPDEIES